MRSIRALVASVAALVALAPVAPAPADDAVPVDFLGPEFECEGFVPYAPLDPLGDRHTARLALVLDGVSTRRATQVARAVQRLYARPFPEGAGTTIRVVDTLSTRFRSSEVTAFVMEPTGRDLMSELIRTHRRLRPRVRADHVHLLTARDIYVRDADGSREYGVAGIANCIGSIGDRRVSYSISEVGTIDEAEALLTFYADVDAKLAAHELGHAFGAHHHYADCGPSAPNALGAGRADLCSVMFPFVDAIAMRFSPLEVTAARGYAEEKLR